MYDSDQSSFEAPPPEESSNRTFLIAAGILGGIVLLSIACLAGYALLILPGQNASRQQAAAAQLTQNAQVAAALTATAQAISFPTATATPSLTPTPVVAQSSATSTPSTVTPDPATATVAAALTQAALAQLTSVPTSTALPGTGIADEYGAPGLVVLGMALIAVIFLARRLRATPTK
jgi:membrane-bound lytic murein transglycosylase B